MPVLGRDKSQGDERLDLAEAVLMNFRRALTDQGDPQSLCATEADKVVRRMQHIPGLRVGYASLRHEQMAFVYEQMQRPAKL